MLGDRLYGLLLDARHRPANPVEAGQVFRQRLLDAEISIQQHGISAMLGQGEMRGVPLVVAAIAFVIIHCSIPPHHLAPNRVAALAAIRPTGCTLFLDRKSVG